MTEQLLSSNSLRPLPRCCDEHPDWATLSEHLIDEFPELTVGVVVREVARAKDAVDTAALGADGLTTGELIARHQLMLLSGRATDIARLDPERHNRADVGEGVA